VTSADEIGETHRRSTKHLVRNTEYLAVDCTKNGTEFRPDPARKLSANLYDIYHCCVYGEETLDDGQTNCPKHVEF